MKHPLIALCIPLVFLFHPVKGSAQEETACDRPVPDWISDKGFWQVETNIHSPWNSTIRFFNNDGIQVYKENIQGMPLDLQKKKTLRRLKKILDQAITAWESGHGGQTGNLLVSRSFRRN